MSVNKNVTVPAGSVAIEEVSLAVVAMPSICPTQGNFSREDHATTCPFRGAEPLSVAKWAAV